MTHSVSGRPADGSRAGPTPDGEVRRRFAARVRVMPRPEILDPQGKAISSALGRLGFGEVGEVRAGKSFDLVLAAPDQQSAEQQVERMCSELLANPIIEDYQIDSVEELPAGSAAS